MSTTGRHIVGFSFIAMLGIVFVNYMLDEKNHSVSVVPATEEIVEPVAEGNGIYYFPVFGEQYRQALVHFFTDNPDLKCSYLGPTERHLGGGLHRINGHILHCQDNDTATPAQDITVP